MEPSKIFMGLLINKNNQENFLKLSLAYKPSLIQLED